MNLFNKNFAMMKLSGSIEKKESESAEENLSPSNLTIQEESPIPSKSLITPKKIDPNSLDEFIKPVQEDHIIVGDRSWCPEDESHEAFKSLIVESFAMEEFKVLKHVAHDLARKCIEWFGTPDAANYTVIIVILRSTDYVYDERLLEMWGSYAEYQINNEYILVFKDGLREGDEPIENLNYSRDALKKQPNAVCQIVDQGDNITDVPTNIDDVNESGQDLVIDQKKVSVVKFEIDEKAPTPVKKKDSNLSQAAPSSSMSSPHKVPKETKTMSEPPPIHIPLTLAEQLRMQSSKLKKVTAPKLERKSTATRFAEDLKAQSAGLKTVSAS